MSSDERGRPTGLGSGAQCQTPAGAPPAAPAVPSPGAAGTVPPSANGVARQDDAHAGEPTETPPPDSDEPQTAWVEVTPSDPCLFCGAVSVCKIKEDDSEAACRGTDGRPGGSVCPARDGSTYWSYPAAVVRQARGDRRVEELRRLIALLHPPDGERVFEVRVLNIRPKRGRPHNAAGYFTDPAVAARAALQYDRLNCEGIYVTVNPPDPLCHARAPDEIIDYQDVTTSDHDILRREWLVIDCDPKRPKGVCAPGEMVEAAGTFAEQLKQTLADRFGWPQPVEAMSGNGQYLLYRIGLPNDHASTELVSAVLKALNVLMAEEVGNE